MKVGNELEVSASLTGDESPGAVGDSAHALGLYLFLAVVQALLAMFYLAVQTASPLVYLVVSVPAAIYLVIRSTRAFGQVINPMSLFAVVWLILIPITSGEAPLMRPMTSAEIVNCLFAGIAYSVGGIIFHAVLGARASAAEGPEEDRPTPEVRRRTAVWLLFVSVAALLANSALVGGFALLSDDDQRKAVGAFIGYPVLSSVGTLGVYLISGMARVQRSVLVLAGTYVVLQALTGQRFVAILGLLLALAGVASARLSWRSARRRVVVLLLATACAFSLVALFRGGAADHERYFVETGLYTGDVAALNATEVVRYIGMSQRNMSEILQAPPGVEPLEYTLSPLTGLGAEVPGGLGTSTYGYTANNIISYLYHDMGNAWPLGLIGISLLVNIAYWRYLRRRGSLTSGYWWAAAALGVSMSFFAYVNAYVYWVFLFPLALYFLPMRKVATSHPARHRALANRMGR